MLATRMSGAEESHHQDWILLPELNHLWQLHLALNLVIPLEILLLTPSVPLELGFIFCPLTAVLQRHQQVP